MESEVCMEKYSFTPQIPIWKRDLDVGYCLSCKNGSLGICEKQKSKWAEPRASTIILIPTQKRKENVGGSNRTYPN